MKTRVLYMLLLMLSAFAGNIKADELLIQDFELEPGQQKEISVELNNPENQYIMLDFYIQLPSGVSIAEDSDGYLMYELNSSRKMRSHSLDIEGQSNGYYHVLLYSSKNEALKGTSGAVFTMTVEADGTAAPGDYTGKLLNQITSDINAQEIDFPDRTFNVKVSGDTPAPTSDYLSISDFEIRKGEQKEISVELNNPENQYIMLDFYIQLPSGVSIAEDSDGYLMYDMNSSRTLRSHSLDIERQSNGYYHVLLYSSKNEALKGTSGAVFTMTVEADGSVTPGDYTGKLLNQITSDINSQEIDFPDRTFNVKVSGDTPAPTSDYLSISDFEIRKGEQKEISVELNNPENQYIMLDFYIQLPSGVSIAEDSDGYLMYDMNSSRTLRSHSLDIERQSNGYYHVLLYSSKNEALKGTSGAVFTMTVEADGSVTPGDYTGKLLNQITSDINAQEIDFPDKTFNIKITDGKQPQSLSLQEIPGKTYGDADLSLPEKTNEGLTISWTSSNVNVASVSGNTLSVTGAGTATVTATQAGDASHNPFSQTFTLTVGKAALTITADDKTKTAGEANPELTVSYSGLVNGESSSVLATQPTVTTTATISSAAGDYPITASGATAANYEITYVAGTLTVVKAGQSISLTELPAMTYGDAAYTLPATTTDGQTLTWTSSNTKVASVSGNTLNVTGAGTATVTATQAGDASHNPFSQTFTLTVGKAALTISADDKTKTAGEANPELTVSYEGFVNGETASVLTKQPSVTTTATTNSVAGDYPITASGASAANYEITYVAGTLTVVKAGQSISLTELPAMTYGDAAYTLPATTTDGQTLTWTSGNSNVASVSGNTLNVTGAGTATVTASQSGDASHNPFSQTFTLRVGKAKLTITADDKMKTAGEANPELTVSYEGFVNGETASVLTKQPSVTTTATTNSVAGDYPITASGAAAANYEITYVAGTLTVVKADQSVSLTELPAMTYGDAAYTLPATTTDGQTLIWTSGNTNVASVSGNTLTVKEAGTATITASHAGDASHNPFSQTFTLTVGRASLTITADDKTKTAGEANPALTVSYEGFVNGETASVLTKQPTVKTTATTNSVAGDYPITVSGASAANYEISYVAGILTVVKADQSISLTELPAMTYGDAAYTLPATTADGQTLTWTSGNTKVASVSGNTLNVTGAGTATVTASHAGDASHNPFSQTFTLTVGKAALTITADDKTKTAGEANPELTVSYEGFVNGETASVLTKQPTVKTTATTNSVAGDYLITVSGATAANYEITYVAGTLTVVKAGQSISLTELPAMIYGDAAYTLPATTADGQPLTWTSGNTKVASVSGNTLSVTGAGTATVTATQAGDASHNPFSQTFTLTVGKAALTITADDKTKTAGEANPELTVSYEGFVNGETASVLTKQPSVTTTATTNSVAGDYPITASGATAANYEITYVAGTLTVVKADQSVLLTELPAMTYGDAAYTLPATTADGQTLTWTSNNAKVAAVSGNTLTAAGAGTATVTATQAGDASHNPFSKTFTLTVNKAPLTITAENKTKTAGEANPELTVAYEGFVNNETESVLTKKPSVTTTATTGSVAGDYPITASGATAANYNITYVAGTLTVIKADQSVTLAEIPALTYGDEAYTLPTTTEGGQPLTWTSSNAKVATVSGNTLTAAGAGTATVTAMQSGDASHNPFSKTFTLTVNKAPLTITAENKTKTAGEANPELTVAYEGFVNNETESVLTKKPTVTTTATTGSVAGDYPITASGATAANYNITYVAGTLTVVKADQSVTLTEIPAMTYGDAAYTLPVSTADGQPLTWTSNNAKVAAVSGNTLTAAGAGTATVTATQAGDASHNPFSQTFTLTVNKAPLTITAENKTKTAGEANPELTVAYEGFVNGETASVLTKQPIVKTTATTNSVAGDYPITASGATAANYDITYVAGTLTVVKADQSVALTEIPAMTYGDAAYTLPVSTADGQTLTWTSSNAKVATVSGNKLTAAGAGTATVTATQAGDASHNPFSKTFTLTVNKAPLTITAENKTKTAGEANPELTVSYEGFVNGETASVLTKQPAVKTTATTNSVAGDYPITVSGATTANYEITYVAGILTVVKADQSVLLTELPTMTYGDTDYTLPALTENGQPLTWTSDNAKVAEISGNTLSVTGAGTATVTATQAGDASHNPFSQTFTLTVGKAKLTITADDKTKTAGEANPEFTLSYEGFVNGDDESDLSSQPAVACEADENSPAGEYAIVLSGGSSDNYELTLVNGTLTVDAPAHLRGDVNEDGKVDISDIVADINQIAGTATYRFADVNEDGKVDISDIVAIINIIAGQ